MRLLLDTHAWLWFVLGASPFHAPVRAIVRPAVRLWLLACIASGVLLAGGFTRPVGIHYANSRFTIEAVSDRGRLWLGQLDRPSGTWGLTLEVANDWEYLFGVGGTSSWRRFGFGYSTFQTGRWHIVLVPSWAVVAALLLLPIGTAVRRPAKMKGMPLRCVTCGYDLRATPDRCPECGERPGEVNVPAFARPRAARWAVLFAGLGFAVWLPNVYLTDRRIGILPTAETLQTALSLAGIVTATLAFGRAPPNFPNGAFGPNRVAAIAGGIALFILVAAFFVPRLNY